MLPQLFSNNLHFYLSSKKSLNIESLCIAEVVGASWHTYPHDLLDLTIALPELRKLLKTTLLKFPIVDED